LWLDPAHVLPCHNYKLQVPWPHPPIGRATEGSATAGSAFDPLGSGQPNSTRNLAVFLDGQGPALLQAWAELHEPVV